MTKKVEKAEIETSGLGTACVDVARRGFVRSGASLLLKGTQSCAGKKDTMKKLMFAATAMLCGAVLAEGEITSNNIVGYAGNALDNDFGAKGMVVPFANVGMTDKGFKLSDIKPIAVEKVTAADLGYNISFQKMDAGGCTVEGSNRTWDGEKWIDDNSTDKSAEAYAPGAGIWMYNQSYNPESFECGLVNLQSAGEVIQENVIADLDDDFGAVMVGNPFPTDLKLADIIPYVEAGDLPGYVVSFQKMDAAGCTVEGSNRTWDGAKWIDDNGNDMSNETLSLGEGVWMYNSNYDESTFECIPGKVRFVAPTF